MQLRIRKEAKNRSIKKYISCSGNQEVRNDERMEERMKKEMLKSNTEENTFKECGLMKSMYIKLLKLMIVMAMAVGICLPGITAKADAIHYLMAYQWTNMTGYHSDNPELGFTMMGVKYTHGFKTDDTSSNNKEVNFNLDATVDTVTFVIGHIDGTRDNSGTLKIYLDGILQEEYTKKLTSDMVNQTVTLDVTGKKQMRISILGDYARYGIGNITKTGSHNYECEITKVATVQDAGLLTYTCSDCGHSYTQIVPARTYCSDYLFPYQVSYMTKWKENFGSASYVSVMGKKYYYALTSDNEVWSDSSSALYNLNSAYSSIEFAVGSIDGSTINEGTMKIYLDGTLVRTVDLEHNMINQSIILNTSGVTQLKFEIIGTRARYCIFDLNATPVAPAIKQHSFVDETLVEAKVGVQGTIKHICSVCGAYYTTTVPALVRKMTDKEMSIELDNSSFIYTGSAIKPKMNIKYDGETLSENVDYTVSYSNNVNPGTATITIAGKGGYQGSITKTFIIEARSISSANVSVELNFYSFYYNGTIIKPNVVVKYGENVLLQNRDYTVSYTDNKNPGQAKVEINGIGGYKGSTHKYFSISLKRMNISSVKSKKKKKLTVKWIKASAVSGYQIQYSKSSYFSSYNTKTKNVSKKKTSVTLTGLKRKTIYYVRMRSYVKVNGENKYSDYGDVKKVKVK